jgi:HD-GYP domain-containing protein (c-di-GMP phosphodiesterase class II)
MSELNYIPIRTTTLRGDQQIEFNVYVKINNKLVLYLRRGDSFEGARLQRLKDKKLKHLFITFEQEKLYRQYLTSNIEEAYDKNSKKSLESRAQIIQGNLQTHSEELIENPEDSEKYYHAKAACGRFASYLNSELQMLSHILNIKNTDQNLAHHCVNVAAIGCAISSEIKVIEAHRNQSLVLGALVHDIDHFYNGIPFALDEKNMTEPQQKKFFSHPLEGFLRINDKKHFESDILDIVAQHEEFIDGRGFPQKLSEVRLNPMSVFVGIANSFDKIINTEDISTHEATKKLLIKKMGCYPLDYIKKLEFIFQKLNFK